MASTLAPLDKFSDVDGDASALAAALVDANARFADVIRGDQKSHKTPEAAARVIAREASKVHGDVQKAMQEAYGTLNRLRHIRVMGHAALRRFDGELSALRHDLELNDLSLSQFLQAEKAVEFIADYLVPPKEPEKPLSLEKARRELGKIIGCAQGQDLRVASRVRDIYDHAIRHCLTHDLLSRGSIVDARRYVEVSDIARDARRFLYTNFEKHGPRDFAGEAIGALVSKPNDGKAALKAIFYGRPFDQSRVTPHILQRLSAIMPEDTEARTALRLLTWRSLTDDDPKLQVARLGGALIDHAELLGQLFSGEELAFMEEFQERIETVLDKDQPSLS